MDIFEISSGFEQKNLADVSANNKLAVSEPCVGDPVVGDGGLRLIFSCEALVVALELVHVGEVVVFVDILARYNKHGWIQIAEGNLTELRLGGGQLNNFSRDSLLLVVLPNHDSCVVTQGHEELFV